MLQRWGHLSCIILRALRIILGSRLADEAMQHRLITAVSVPVSAGTPSAAAAACTWLAQGQDGLTSACPDMVHHCGATLTPTGAPCSFCIQGTQGPSHSAHLASEGGRHCAGLDLGSRGVVQVLDHTLASPNGLHDTSPLVAHAQAGAHHELRVQHEAGQLLPADLPPQGHPAPQQQRHHLPQAAVSASSVLLLGRAWDAM